MRMFHEQGKGVVFMELVKNLKYQRHTVIECIPVPYGTVEDAPMYFQVQELCSYHQYIYIFQFIN
jgi:hypothetical protein